MREREMIRRPDYVYPVDEWRMVEARFYPRLLPQMETLFATANGYLGMRGSVEERRPVFLDGTFVNGFYESWPIVYGEDAHGFPKTGQTILNVTDAKTIRLYVDDEPFYLPTANLLDFERALDMRAGSLDRRVLWETPTGKQVQLKSRRIVSFQHRHLAAILYEVTLLNAEAPVLITSEMINEDTQEAEHNDPRRPRGFRGPVLLPELHYESGLRQVLSHRTKSSRMSIACGTEHVIETDCEYECRTACSGDRAEMFLAVDARPGMPVRLVKFIAYHTSRSAPPRELCHRVEHTLDRARRHGFDALSAGQRAFLDEFWEVADVEVDGDPAVQQALRFNIFHVLQAAGRAEGVGVPAKGLTGQGYEGHYFWDTEIYVLPFLIYTRPHIARNLLKFRHSHLDRARQRAREVNQKGALFPWRTINGHEASAYYAAGTAQYHINADIAHAVRKYVEITGDEEFLFDYGAELLVETARLWLDLGFFSLRKGGKFCIAGVTGPDEYNTVVNNNVYTNLMARNNLHYAAETVERMRQEQRGKYTRLLDRTNLEEAEVAAWQRAADNMYLPYDEALGIHPQDDEFLDKKPWDFEHTPAENYPLLLHYHPLVIYRHQVIKQADVVLAMFLLGDEFSAEQKRRNFDFYDPLTTGDSSLSVSIQCVLAAELGYRELATRYARYAVMMDIGDVAGNVRDGCHVASMGGTWMAIVYGLLGLRDYGGRVRFRPLPPLEARRFRVTLRIRDQLLGVEVDAEKVIYTLREGDALDFWHNEEHLRLAENQRSVERPVNHF